MLHKKSMKYKLIIIFSIRLASDEKRTLKNVKEREFYFTILVKREIDTSFMLNFVQIVSNLLYSLQ